MSKIVVSVGQRIHDWKIVDAPAKGKITAKCLCGNLRLKWACDFVAHPRCSSCAKRLVASRVDTFALVVREHYSDYKANAKSAGREFLLEPGDRYAQLITSNCHYCGLPPARAVAKRSEVVLVSGIDRLDSTVGYQWDNVVSCCTTCNLMKNVLTKEEFVSHIKRIIDHLSTREVSE